VVVLNKSGEPVSGLQPGEFKLLDNQQPQSIISVQAANGMKAHADPPVEVFLVIDAINVPFLERANQRQWLTDFFNENGKELALPTSLVVLTDNGITEQNQPTRNGGSLLPVLDASYAGFMQIKRYQRLEGALLREEDSLKALNLFALQQGKRPGRKLFIWLGSGWTVASNPMSIGGPKKRQHIYNYIASLSTALREARITLYEVIPGSGFGRGDIYMQYVKGVRDPEHVDLGDLSLPVLATQTGGQVLMGSNDLGGLIDRCIADAKADYVLTFTPPPAAHPTEYHAIHVQLDKPGLKARTRSGYYTPPANNEQPPVAISLRESTAAE
jgi:VWFA-related protein